MRAMLPISSVPKLNPPPGDDGSFSFTPSISATVWSLSAPRMLSEAVVPTPPLRATVTPGVCSNRSDTVAAWRRSIVAVSITVTDCPTRSIGVAVRFAVTTMSLPALVASSRPATDCADWPLWASAGAVQDSSGNRIR